MYFIVSYSRTPPRIQHPRSAETQCSPVVLFGVSNESLTRVVPGVTHIYTTQSEPHRTYHLHFVTLSGPSAPSPLQYKRVLEYLSRYGIR